MWIRYATPEREAFEHWLETGEMLDLGPVDPHEADFTAWSDEMAEYLYELGDWPPRA